MRPRRVMDVVRSHCGQGSVCFSLRTNNRNKFKTNLRFSEREFVRSVNIPDRSVPFCSFHVKCSTFNQFLLKKEKKKKKLCQCYMLSCHGIAVPVSWGGLWFDLYRLCCSHIMQCRAVPLHYIVSASEQRNEAFAWNSTCNLAATIFFPLLHRRPSRSQRLVGKASVCI